MKKNVLLGVLFVGLIWTLLMLYINSRSTTLDVQVAAQVDEVRFYQVQNPQEPIITIATQGNNRSAMVELRNSLSHSIWVQGAPAQYYFVAVRGRESNRSPVICCGTGFANQRASLMIHDLHSWEKSTP